MSEFHTLSAADACILLTMLGIPFALPRLAAAQRKGTVTIEEPGRLGRWRVVGQTRANGQLIYLIENEILGSRREVTADYLKVLTKG